MTVVVYPRLGTWLHARDLSVAELERRIDHRFGLAVDPKILYRLASAEPVQRADLAIAGAAAAVLGVGLGDLFERQAEGALSAQEQAELEALVGDYGRRLHEQRIRELTRWRRILVEQARRETETNSTRPSAGGGTSRLIRSTERRSPRGRVAGVRERRVERTAAAHTAGFPPVGRSR